MNVVIQEFQPSFELAPYVTSFWEGDFNINRSSLLTQRVVPNGYLEIIIHVTPLHCELFKNGNWSHSPDHTIIGMHTEPYIVKFNDVVKVFGIRLKPEGIFNLFAIPSSLFRDKYEDMEDVLGNDFRILCSQIRESLSVNERISFASNYLIKSLQKNKIEYSYINRAAEVIRNRKGAIIMDELSDEACISRRQLERAFYDKLGISPKQYMRLSRLNEVHRLLELKEELNLTSVSHLCGYADQAHFIREFKSFMGYTPTVFIKNRSEFIVNLN
jgi:AraC-like DNA-binding protein